MNTIEIIEKQLTEREYYGYLKGKILELRFSLTADMSPIDQSKVLQLSAAYEKKLQRIETIRKRRSANAQCDD